MTKTKVLIVIYLVLVLLWVLYLLSVQEYHMVFLVLISFPIGFLIGKYT